jgi:hypothetical protein
MAKRKIPRAFQKKAVPHKQRARLFDNVSIDMDAMQVEIEKGMSMLNGWMSFCNALFSLEDKGMPASVKEIDNIQDTDAEIVSSKIKEDGTDDRTL